MGMSASQARLMTLTARLSDLEYSAQAISNAKIRLADNTEDAATKYSAALDLQKLTVYSSDTSSYVDATAANLTTFQGVSSLDKQRFLTNSSGQVLVSESLQNAYNSSIAKTDNQNSRAQGYFDKAFSKGNKWQSAFASNGSDFNGFVQWAMWDHNENTTNASDKISTNSPDYKQYETYYGNLYSGLESFLNQYGLTSNDGLTVNNPKLDPDQGSYLNTSSNRGSLVYDEAKVGYYTDLFNSMNRGNGDKSTISEKTNQYFEDLENVSDKKNTYYDNMQNGIELFLQSQGCTSDPDYTKNDGNLSTDESKVQYYTNMFNEINKQGSFTTDPSNMNDNEWLYQQLNNGTLYIENFDYDGGVDGTGDFVNVPWESGDSSVRKEDDKSAVAKAQAEYDVAMARIESKDKKYDLELKQIDTEHTAVQTEIDSVKKVIDKNIERSFKIFDA